MKRRHIIRSLFLGSAFLTFINSRSHSESNQLQSYDWVFLYWMPYDNDLSHFGQGIIQDIASGIQSENILVTVQADFLATPNLTRYLLTKGEIDRQELDVRDSANESVFADYLTWARSQFIAKHWAIVFLGHGGNTDEISPDVNSGLEDESVRWMNIQTIRDRLLEFNEIVNDKIELFFFQNCNKGTLEAHQTLSDAAEYTLSSQKILGAPNYYYSNLFEWLGNYPERSGEEVARQIEVFERSDMYSSYTVTKNSIFRELDRYIVPLIDSVLAANVGDIELNQLETYSYFDELQADAIAFFTTVVEQSKADREKLNDFINFIQRSTIHLPNPEKNSQHLSGLGLFVPTRREQLDRYRNWQTYVNLKLLELFDAIFDATST